jgi:hypothetical protein
MNIVDLDQVSVPSSSVHVISYSSRDVVYRKTKVPSKFSVI